MHYMPLLYHLDASKNAIFIYSSLTLKGEKRITINAIGSMKTEVHYTLSHL